MQGKISIRKVPSYYLIDLAKRISALLSLKKNELLGLNLYFYTTG